LSGENEITPRLGRISDVGAGSAKSFGKRVTKAIARLGRSGKSTAFSGRNYGRGLGALPQAKATSRTIPRSRMRRVIVKVHIARARGPSGARAFGQHVHYVQRDGVERDGSGGELYGREGQTVDGRAFTERSAEDRHQFRLTVSAEEAGELGDLKGTTRALIAQMERDLGTELDWVAVDHHNTGHSHTHVIIRGKDELGHDLVMARSYLTEGIRGRAAQIVTDELGPRRDQEIARSLAREVAQDRFTSLDRVLERAAREGRVSIEAARGSADRFARSLQLQRLSHLEGLGLAAAEGPGLWRLTTGWQSALKTMGRRGDIIRTLAAGLDRGDTARGLRFFGERASDAKALTGIVIVQGPGDELRDTRFLLIEDFSGTRWHVSAAGVEPGGLPPRGAIVEVSAAPGKARASDKVIAEIAERNGGYYSDALHAEADPSASANYREAHKRRLEALRRAGIVSRRSDGVWEVGEDYLRRAAEFEAARGGGVKIEVRSWMAMEAQIEARAETWLDQVGEAGIGDPEPRLIEARRMRLAFLRREGFLDDGQDGLSDEARKRLRFDELRRAAVGEQNRSARFFSALETGERFEGNFERTADLAQGRMAIIGNEKAFAMVPWRPDLERQRGRSLVIEVRERGISWTLPGGRQRGIGR